MNGKNKASALRFWILVWGLGLIGQLVWNIENQWFNTFVYAKIAKDPTIISWMVAISAIATAISTFVFGTTEFIAAGKGGDTVRLLVLAATAVVLADALMSFFGSMGNDAGFNAWLNDNMNDKNRSHIGAALVFDARRAARRFEALRRGHAARDFLNAHASSPIKWVMFSSFRVKV